ncbi:MAG: hypothetical protein WCD57_25020 [Acidobacteriaceae bacterium]
MRPSATPFIRSSLPAWVQPRRKVSLGAQSTDQAPRKGFSNNHDPVTATIHPSAILCTTEAAAKDAEIASLVEGLKIAAEYATARRPL